LERVACQGVFTAWSRPPLDKRDIESQTLIASRPAVSLVDASIGYSPAHSHWTVALWGKNLTNQIYAVGLGGGNPPGLFVSDPRTYGLRVNYTY